MTPDRIRNPNELTALLKANAPAGLIDEGFSAADWMTDPRNIALRIDDDLAMFAHCGAGIVQGHVWFASRGKEAIERGKIMLAAMFDDYGCQVIIGETPTFCRAALSFIRKLGFRPIGVALRPQGKVIVSELVTANLPALKLVA